ncbi:hypothetical protein CDAR_622111 [Caerostris darwini]|uniref:Uncharacterized protein n=1 Tax=Caerostris darwini TaxID=1538125 RepID=A0AAV4R549_9ARAC|nr:hypothetical protein CDAR_7501 [Caerostris darwini]GIY25917.1 hypothetical protein CDAR_622111 [Caerostris darwini]
MYAPTHVKLSKPFPRKPKTNKTSLDPPQTVNRGAMSLAKFPFKFEIKHPSDQKRGLHIHELGVVGGWIGQPQRRNRIKFQIVLSIRKHTMYIDQKE